MRAFVFQHLTDPALLRDLSNAVAHDRESMATVLARMAEADARKAYLPEGYPSMHAYCVGVLRYSANAALKRIQAARVARRFPVLFDALAEGRLHLCAVRLLAPHLTDSNVDELIAAAAWQSRPEIEALLAQRFGRADELPMSSGDSPSAAAQHATWHVGAAPAGEPAQPLAPAEDAAPDDAAVPAGAASVPQGPRVRSYRLGIDEGKLEYARALLSHALPAGNVSEVVDRGLDALIELLEKRKFGAARKPRSAPSGISSRKRHLPAYVRCAVWKRDHGRCTFVGDTGHRCESRRFLEFDHVNPVARGGQPTVEGLRLRCRGHNQLEAERAFGAEFMREKRDRARRAREERCSNPMKESLLAGLRGLGIRAFDATRAVELTENMVDATLEERMRAALKLLCPKTVRMAPVNGRMVLAPA